MSKSLLFISPLITTGLLVGVIVFATRKSPQDSIQPANTIVEPAVAPVAIDWIDLSQITASIDEATTPAVTYGQDQLKIKKDKEAKLAAEKAASEAKIAAEKAAAEAAKIRTFNCLVQNCFYAAVDKENALPSTYVPSLTTVGGKQMQTDAAQKMNQMIADIQTKNINVEITSAYRSYQTQAQTFSNWTDIIKARSPGMTQAQAEAEANTFSARPGHSEHQLGTTADLNTVGATAFDKVQNAALYDYIEKNAHKYGFVITYPKGQQSLTGYVHEPWHVRYIGIDLASELFATGYVNGNGIYSTQFLRNKGLSS